MRELVVLRGGLLGSVQDLGRPNYRSSGVAIGGALDPIAVVVANRMTGNPDNAATVEVTMGNCAFRFENATRFALAGADTRAHLDGEAIAPWSSSFANAGQTLELGAPAVGIRTILAVEGGIAVPPVLDSRSTDLSAAFGGYEGRSLKTGDRLPLGDGGNPFGNARFRVKPPQWEFDSHEVGALKGPEYETFSSTARSVFWDVEWIVTPRSNRMGYALQGPALGRAGSREGMELSHAVFPGVVQVPPSGQPIVLLNDAQTTGGYPAIAVVTGADLRKLSDLALGAKFRFKERTLAEAADARRNLERYLMEVTTAIQSMVKSA